MWVSYIWKKKKTRVQWQSHDVSLYNKSCHECIRMFQPLRVYKRREFFIGQQIGHSLQDISSILAYFSEDFHIFLRCKAEFLKLNFVVIEKPLVKIPSLCLSLLWYSSPSLPLLYLSCLLFSLFIIILIFPPLPFLLNLYSQFSSVHIWYSIYFTNKLSVYTMQEDMEVERPKNIESEEDGMLEWADDGEFSPPMSLAEDRDKFLIFTTGSKTYSPHQIGVCIRVPQIMPDMIFFFF